MSTFAKANMASPIQEGTMGAMPFISQFVDVEHEELQIKIDKNFEFATFKVTYYINASKTGLQIPFLFYASEIVGEFDVKIDGKKIELLPYTFDNSLPDSIKFKDFSFFFDPEKKHMKTGYLLLGDQSDGGFYVRLEDMLHFKTDIEEGKHQIEVNYTAKQWRDKSDWVTKFSFRYVLSPAKYWKSFGTLKVIIDASDFKNEIKTNIGNPKTGDLQKRGIWEFTSLPTDILEINFHPELSKTAKFLIDLDPFGLAILVSLLLIIFHYLWVKGYRKNNPDIKYSSAVIIGSLLIPLLFCILWVYFYTFIDMVIGEYASERHGYTILFLIFYPLIVPVYWLIFWLLDKQIKKKIT